ncbi:MAG: hypothetical protein DIAAKJNI_00568 [Candidatus Argoarchaeum ethanivorans]|uniref:Uncharacterized protein n=1 Tax=Candidatus Argoarchaeum ethanivorans TaxID=2608793 RepID=A0A811TDW9_9EURY|nr:MAG: hypothetical protein DIAAKJNI_00568 [Candidatus Argoarchaeum ethanivorans]
MEFSSTSVIRMFPDGTIAPRTIKNSAKAKKAVTKFAITPAVRMRTLSFLVAIFLSIGLLSLLLPNNCSSSGSAKAPIGIGANNMPSDLTRIPSTLQSIACENSCTIKVTTRPISPHVSGMKSLTPGINRIFLG